MGSCDSGFICPASMLLGAVIDYTPRCVWMDIEESQWVVTGAALMANMNHDRLNTFLPSFLHSSFNHSFTVRNHPPLSGSSNLRFRSWEFSPHHTLTNDRLDLCWGVGAVNIRKGQNPQFVFCKRERVRCAQNLRQGVQWQENLRRQMDQRVGLGCHPRELW